MRRRVKVRAGKPLARIAHPAGTAYAVGMMNPVDSGEQPTAAGAGRLDPRVPLAAERTLLAWIRTGVALMGFGFVVARFGVFLHEMTAIRNAPAGRVTLSIWVGMGMVLLGVMVNLLSAAHYRRLITRLERGEAPPPRPSLLGVAVAVVLGILGLMLATYLATMAW